MWQRSFPARCTAQNAPKPPASMHAQTASGSARKQAGPAGTGAAPSRTHQKTRSKIQRMATRMGAPMLSFSPRMATMRRWKKTMPHMHWSNTRTQACRGGRGGRDRAGSGGGGRELCHTCTYPGLRAGGKQCAGGSAEAGCGGAVWGARLPCLRSGTLGCRRTRAGTSCGTGRQAVQAGRQYRRVSSRRSKGGSGGVHTTRGQAEQHAGTEHRHDDKPTANCR